MRHCVLKYAPFSGVHAHHNRLAVRYDSLPVFMCMDLDVNCFNVCVPLCSINK